MRGWKSRSGQRMRERGTPTAPSDCRPIWMITASMSEFIASSAFARNSACAASRSGNSRRPPIRGTACPWLYLAGVKDLFSGELVGYALDKRMTQDLVMQALFRVVGTRRLSKGLIHHSDRGSQYCSLTYQKLLRQFGMQVSMSRKGNCWDNAPMESCRGPLKTELLHHPCFATREQAKREITEYIEIFYNRVRKQARLGSLSPAAFNQKYHAKMIAA